MPVRREKRGQTRERTRPSAMSSAGTPSRPTAGDAAITPRMPSGRCST